MPENLPIKKVQIASTQFWHPLRKKTIAHARKFFFNYAASMANTTFQIPKAHIAMAICLPLAVLLGYVLAEPLESGSVAVVVFVLAILCVPIMLKWHHPILILCWNAAFYPAFLPSRAALWLPLAGVSLIIAIINRAVSRDEKFINVPQITTSLAVLGLVVVVTGFFTGGFGSRLLGSAQMGGSKYYYLLGAIIGYFAITSRRIPADRGYLYIALFFLSALTAALANLAFAIGPSMNFIFALISPELATDQAVASVALNPAMARIGGLSWACPAVYSWLLARHGVRGVFDLTKPWRALFFLVALYCGLFGGFRSVLVTFLFTFTMLFLLEGLHRTRYLFLFGTAAVIAGFVLVSFANRLPMSVQRTLSVLPIQVDPLARQSAQDSSNWRIQMWEAAVPEIPKYLFHGKGYSLDVKDVQDALMPLGPTTPNWLGPLAMGDYHNGPLSLLIPFGIYGVIAFCWFLYVSLRVLYQYWKFGNPALRRINAFLLAAFAARVLLFFFVFGSLNSDMAIFAGLLGLAVSLNGPVPSTVPEVQEDPALELESPFNEGLSPSL